MASAGLLRRMSPSLEEESAVTTRMKVTATTENTPGLSLGSEDSAKEMVPRLTFSSSGPLMAKSMDSVVTSHSAMSRKELSLTSPLTTPRSVNARLTLPWVAASRSPTTSREI